MRQCPSPADPRGGEGLTAGVFPSGRTAVCPTVRVRRCGVMCDRPGLNPRAKWREAPFGGCGMCRHRTRIGGGRVRALAGCRRSRPVHRKSFWWVLAGRSPASTHQKQFARGLIARAAPPGLRQVGALPCAPTVRIQPCVVMSHRPGLEPPG